MKRESPHTDAVPSFSVSSRGQMGTTLHRLLTVHGIGFDVSIEREADGRETVRVAGPELQNLMQLNEHAELRAAFRDELDRVRARRR